jgi:hypothetical protein
VTKSTATVPTSEALEGALRDSTEICVGVRKALCAYPTRVKQGPRLAAAAIAASISDGLVAVITLVGSLGQAHTPTVVRGMIESIADLSLICENEDFIKPLMLNAIDGKVKLGNGLLNSSVYSEEERAQLLDALKDQGAKLKGLQKAGIKPLRFQDKLKRIDHLPWEFVSFYFMYSGSVHNDLNAVGDRHLRGDKIVLGVTLSDSDAINILSVACACAYKLFALMPAFLRVTEAELEPRWQPLATVLGRLAARSP